MKIENIRMGFATNSSSTHSLVFFSKIRGPKGKTLDALRGGAGVDGDVGGDDNTYGWDHFVLMSEAKKRAYVAQMLYSNLVSEMGEDIAEAVARAWTSGEVDRDGYIDHQSRVDLPRSWDGRGIDKEFFDDLLAYFTQEDIAILGGNDNAEEGPPPVIGETQHVDFRHHLPVDGRDPYVARRDGIGGYWTLFHRGNGTKLRVRLKEGEPMASHTQSEAPELVDLKITDFCPFGCSYCYQDSTLKGQHADYDTIQHIAYVLGSLRVFEVAIGGGEPTLHPKFEAILAAFRQQGVVPNFTTKNLGWLHDTEVAARIEPLIGAFAYSVEDVQDLEKLDRAVKVANFPRQKVRVQHVLGVKNYGLESVLTECKRLYYPVTLLGYKAVGRGKKHRLEEGGDLREWVKLVKRMEKAYELPQLGVDTAIIREYESELKAAGVREQLYTRHEGQFSCYIDGVKEKLYASSYEPGDGHDVKQDPTIPFEDRVKRLLGAYKKVAPKPKVAA